jgi:thioredoxin-related protein
MRIHRRLVALLLITASSLFAQQQLKMNPKLYDPSVDAKKEIAATLLEAKKDHKRTILVFGGNWCFDCHVLDYRFHEEGIRETVEQNYHVVHVDIGKYDKNLELPEKYGTTIKKGVPALAILDPNGKIVFGDLQGEFENARGMDPNAILAFLEKWKK